MPVDNTYERLGWTRQQYAKHIGRANLEGGQATGLAVQQMKVDRPWVIGWVGVNGQTLNVGIRVFCNGVIQGFATDNGLGAGFATQSEAEAAARALGYTGKWIEVAQYRGQMNLFEN